MQFKIKEIVKKTKLLQSRLKKELENEKQYLMKKYWFYLKQGKIIFYTKVRKYNKKFKENLFKYIITIRFIHFLSLPFIYAMIIPSIILDIFISIFQLVAFTLYWIPKVKRWDYIIFDRKHLDYLNILQKIHCCYCSYVNWLFNYSSEIAWRTERYWCPIKHFNNRKYEHSQYWKFSDYWDPEWFKEKMNKYSN